MTSIKEQVQEAMKAAMRAKEQNRLKAIRLIMAALKQFEVDNRSETLDDAKTLSILDKMLKQRKESIRQYLDAKREDLVAEEEYEVTVIEEFMPKKLPEAEVDLIIKDALATTGASSIKDMGKVIAILRPKLQGRADMAAVSAKVKEVLN